MVKLVYGNRGFQSAFGANPGKGNEGVVVFNTLWQFPRKDDLYVSRFFRVEMEAMAAEASIQVLNRFDFVIDPKGFEIEIDDEWETMEKWKNCIISPPMHLQFLPGCGLVSAGQDALGQFQEDTSVLELYVGRQMTPATIVRTQKGKLGVYSHKTQTWEPRMDKKDILRELVKAATISKYAEAFHNQREAYIRQRFEELTR